MSVGTIGRMSGFSTTVQHSVRQSIAAFCVSFFVSQRQSVSAGTMSTRHMPTLPRAWIESAASRLSAPT